MTSSEKFSLTRNSAWKPVVFLSSWLAALSLSALVSRGIAVEITTSNRSYSVRVGDSVTLECEFFADGDFNLFDFPVVWKKRQVEEELQVNMMGNLVQPFLSTARFRPSFKSRTPRYHFGLTITDILPEDNGNYSCEITGPQNVILGLVTHHLFVSTQVERIILTNENSSDLSSLHHTYTLELTEDTPHPMGCVAFGGYPAPEIDLYLGHRRLTSGFEWKQSAALTGKKGLRSVYLTTARWNRRFVATSADDGIYVKCVVRNANHPTTNTTVSKLSVNFAPRLSCDNATGVSGGGGGGGGRHGRACLRCEVRAKPPASAVYWIVDENNGTTVHDGKPVDNIWTLTMQRTDGVIEVQLYTTQDPTMDEGDGRTYVLVAENLYGKQELRVPMKQGSFTSSSDALKSKLMFESNLDPTEAGCCCLLFDLRSVVLMTLWVSIGLSLE